MRRVRGLVWILAVALAACASPPPETPRPSLGLTWIAVLGPMDWMPPQEMSLEMDGRAWSITPPGGGGVVTPDLTAPARVRLVTVIDCRVYSNARAAGVMCSAEAPLRPSAIPIQPRVFPQWVGLLVRPQHLPGTPLDGTERYQPNG